MFSNYSSPLELKQKLNIHLIITEMRNYRISNGLQLANYLLSNVQTGASIGWDGNIPDSGYMVGLQGHGLEFESVSAVNSHRVAEWIAEQHVTSNEAGFVDYFGVWVDSETGRVYFDVSNNLQDLAVAEFHGRLNHQIAVWDLNENREIIL